MMERVFPNDPIECLGKGFDLTSDFRFKFAKGKRLVVVDEENKRDITVPGGATIPNVSEDIRCDKGDRLRFRSDVLQFNQVHSLSLFLFLPTHHSYLCMIVYLNFISENWFVTCAKLC